jgi:hypothetical protein
MSDDGGASSGGFMANETMTHERRTETPARLSPAAVMRREPEYQAYTLLHIGFVAAPLIAGVDKYLHWLVDWNIYASHAFASVFGGNVPLMMHIVGAVEIVAGLIVAFRPRIGGLIVAAWLAGIILNLLLVPGYFDIALRDFGLLLGALSLSLLSRRYARA